MSKGYWVGAYRAVGDPSALVEYSRLAKPAILAAGGRFLSRGVATEVREAGMAERTVIIEFNTLEMALAAYESELYQQALAAPGDAVERDMRIVRGLD